MGDRLDTLADVYAVLQTAKSAVRVLDHVPMPGEVPRTPGGVFPVYTGADGSYFNFQVETYVGASDPDVETAYKASLELLDAVDAVFSDATVGPPNETHTFNQQLDAWVGIFPLRMPRDDT